MKVKSRHGESILRNLDPLKFNSQELSCKLALLGICKGRENYVSQSKLKGAKTQNIVVISEVCGRGYRWSD